MSFIFRWKPSVMPLFLVNRHMAAISPRQLWSVFASVCIGAKFSALYWVYTKVWGGVCCKLKVGAGC
jgi:hypothetical protein